MKTASTDPSQLQHLVELARHSAASGNWAVAIQHLQHACALPNPTAEAWQMLGASFMRTGQPAQALHPLRQAYLAAPSTPGLLRALAEAEFQVGAPEDALPLWQQLDTTTPDINIILKHAETLCRLGRLGDAVKRFEDALKVLPQEPTLWFALGQVYEDTGQADAAENAYQQAHQRVKAWSLPIAGLIGLKRGKSDAELLAKGQKLLSVTASDVDRAQLGYALGRAYDAQEKYDEAMHAWQLANTAREKVAGRFDARQLEQHIDTLINTFSHDFFRHAPHGSQDNRPIFIVGMPRSGTTLLEQVLASHSQIAGCGELANLPSLIAKMDSHWPFNTATLSAETLATHASAYLQAANTHADKPNAARLIDKAPLNFFNLSLVALLFPNARIIWCRRDPRDIAISIYGENFSPESRFATRLESIAAFISQQNRLMQHWQTVLPLPIKEVVYENLVDDFETTTRDTLAFLGLQWEPRCHDFHQRALGVQTPSRWQVRQPLNRRGIGRWQHYQSALTNFQITSTREIDSKQS